MYFCKPTRTYEAKLPQTTLSSSQKPEKKGGKKTSTTSLGETHQALDLEEENKPVGEFLSKLDFP